MAAGSVVSSTVAKIAWANGSLHHELHGHDDLRQREHRRELAEPGPGQVPGQPVGGLGDQHHHGQVIEQLERADHPLARLLAVRTRRLPQGAAQPSLALLHPVRLLS